MRPSEIVLLPPIPLTATMGRAERELAAALLVLAMRAKGDEFGAVGMRDVGEALKAISDSAKETGELPAEKGWLTLPTVICSPDFRDLVAQSYAELAEPEREWESPLRFTEKGLEALRKWWRQPEEKTA
ncbi:MAG: hypothetical protein JJ863_21560 [Deltaproteobacteria bacterium]|nr:hypothetical protein [Deltaproteobacteria bacterium]